MPLFKPMLCAGDKFLKQNLLSPAPRSTIQFSSKFSGNGFQVHEIAESTPGTLSANKNQNDNYQFKKHYQSTRVILGRKKLTPFHIDGNKLL